MPSLGIYSLAFVGLLIFSSVEVCVAKYDVCPSEHGTSIQDTFGYLQTTKWKRIPCPTYRPGESLDGVIWYKGLSVDDPSTVILISRDLRGGITKDTHTDERYSMSSNHTLVIEGFDERDEGNFLCQVIPHTTDVRVGSEDVQGTSIQDVFGTTGYLQKMIWHRIFCPTFRTGESLDGVIWYKGPGVKDPSTIQLISRDLREGTNEDTHTDERYSMSSNHSLVIEGVSDRDEGSFLCQVIPKTTDIRVGKVDTQVIGDTFPRGSSQVSSTYSFQRGRRQTLQCECARQIPDTPMSVVYWSMADGATTDTHIIGVHFSDGTTLQIQHGADYSIGCDGSLTVNSLYTVHDTQIFWCHVFQKNGTLRSCDTVVQMLDRPKQKDAFRASLSSFYLLEGEEQTLPCFSWIPGSTTCEVQWLKINSSGQHLLLSSNDHDADSEFDLASDFGLIIKSVDGDDSGRYRCDTGRRSTTDDVDVRVIGQRFPLDGGGVSASSEIDFEVGKNYTLTCQAASNLAEIGGHATAFWSFDNPGNTTTTMIGRLVIPGGTKTMSDLGDNGCFSISIDGALLLNRCFQDDYVRYWCHVFPKNELLIRSYVDVVIKKSAVVDDEERFRINITVITGVCGGLGLIVAVVCVPLCRSCRKGAYQSVKTTSEQTEMGTVERNMQTDQVAEEGGTMNYVNSREKTVELLRIAADKHTEVYKNVQATKVAGGGAGLVGTGLAIVGCAAAFFTGGVYLGLVIAGASVGAASEAIQVAGTIAQVKASKKAKEKVKQILAEDPEAFAKFKHRLEQIDTSWHCMSTSGNAVLKTAASILAFVVLRIGAAVGKVGKAVGQSTFKAIPKFGQAMAVSSVVFFAIAMPIDARTVYKSSVNLQNEVVPKVAQSIYQIIDEFDCPSDEDMEVEASISRTTCEITEV